MRITIVGAGAMGSLVAARLTQAMTSPGADASGDAIERVLLYGRPSAHLDAVRAHGLRLTELDGSEQTVAIETASDPADVRGSDVVIVLVKAWASSAVSSQARPAKVRPAGMAISGSMPIGTVTVGMPRWRMTRLTLAKQVPLRQEREAEAGLKSASDGPM